MSETWIKFDLSNEKDKVKFEICEEIEEYIDNIDTLITDVSINRNRFRENPERFYDHKPKNYYDRLCFLVYRYKK